MKLQLTLLLLLSSFLSFANEPVVVTGKITDSNVKNVKFYLQDLIKDETTKTAKLNKNGEFRLEFDQRYAHDNSIIINKRWIRFFSSPGSNIHVEFSEKEDRVLFSGDYSEMNSEIEKLNNTKNISKVHPYGVRDYRNIVPIEYRNQGLILLKEYNDFLDTYHAENNSSQLFKNWTYSTAKYLSYEDIMNTLQIQRKYYTKKHLPKGIFDFLNENDDFDSSDLKDIMSSSAVNGFIESYINEISIRLPRPKGLARFSTKKTMPLAIDYIVKHTEGKMREIVLTKIFYGMADGKDLNLFKEHLPTFNKYVKDEGMRALIASESKKLEEMMKTVRIPDSAELLSLNEDKDLAPLVEEIVKNNENKVIYIDFWGTWCEPCLKEMPYSKELQAKFKNKEVAFVYLCAESEEDSWKATISELGIEGQHYLLSEVQYALLQDFFNITGLPHYALIDKNGEVVNKETLPPSDEELTKEIKKLLK